MIALLLGIRAVEERNVADTLYQFRPCRQRELGEHRVALVAVADPRPDLDQLVIGERPVELGDERGAEPALAGENDRLAVVAKSAQVFLLRIGEHGR